MGRAEIFIAGGTRKGSFFSVRNGNFERHAYTHGCSFGRAGVDNGYLGTRADKANAESAACALASANYQFNYALQTAVFAIQKSYYQYAAAVTAIEARKSSLEDAENSLKNAENRLQNGLGRSQAVLLAKAEKLQAEYELIAAEAALEQCRAELALAVGVPVSKEFQIEVTFNDFEPLAKEVTTLLEGALKGAV